MQMHTAACYHYKGQNEEIKTICAVAHYESYLCESMELPLMDTHTYKPVDKVQEHILMSSLNFLNISRIFFFFSGGHTRDRFYHRVYYTTI